MTRAVPVVQLSGTSPDEALGVVHALLGNRLVADLSDLLVLDDTAALPDHGMAFEHLLTSGRVNHLICLAIGPPAQRGRMLLPGNIGAGHGSAILWVGDQIGVEWPVAGSAVAVVRPDGAPSGLQHLTEVLSSVEMFDRVRTLAADVPNGVACPGLRLAESDAEATPFPAALAGAIDRLLQPHVHIESGHEEAFAELAEIRPGGVLVSQDGALSRARKRCVASADEAGAALDDLVRVVGPLSPGQHAREARELVVAAGRALTDLNELVAVVLDDLTSDGQTGRQRERLRHAGLSLGDRSSARPGGDPYPSAGVAAKTVSSATIVSKAIADGLRSGDDLQEISARLAATERHLHRKWRRYRSELEQHCPSALRDRLLDPPPFPAPQPWLPLVGGLAAALGSAVGIAGGAVTALVWTGIVSLAVHRAGSRLSAARLPLAANLLASLVGAAAGYGITNFGRPSPLVALAGVALALLVVATGTVRSWRARAEEWRLALSPNQAAESAAALIDLVATVAGHVSSADPARLETVARARIGIDGICRQLGEYADGGATSRGSQQQTPRSARLGHILLPTLIDLIVAVLRTQLDQPATDGQADYRHAQLKTTELIGAWTAHAEEHGPLAPPPFSTVGDYGVVDAAQAWQDAIRDAIGYDPRGLMWQLCLPSDLAMLDVAGPLRAVPFAPRMTRSALSAVLPPDTEWTSVGHHAGLLRLVPLRLTGVTTIWSTNDEREQVR